MQATEQSEKVRENRLRRMAERQGLALVKSRRRDPRAIDFGCWMIVEPNRNIVVAGTEGTGRPNMDLDDVEAYLRGVPKIEVELWRMGRAYIESRGENRDELRALVHDAIEAGMSREQVAHVTGVPLGQITALNREAKEGE